MNQSFSNTVSVCKVKCIKIRITLLSSRISLSGLRIQIWFMRNSAILPPTSSFLIQTSLGRHSYSPAVDG